MFLSNELILNIRRDVRPLIDGTGERRAISRVSARANPVGADFKGVSVPTLLVGHAPIGRRSRPVATSADRYNRMIVLYSAGAIAVLMRADLGAPTRRRRSDRDSPPPTNIATLPSQISSTRGL